MADNMKLGIVVGGVVSPTVGAAFSTVEGRVKRLKSVTEKSKVLQGTITDTIRLREEWRKAHASGTAGADALRKKLESNLSVLRREGVEVRNLTKAHQQMARTIRKQELRQRGGEQLKSGFDGIKKAGAAGVAGVAAMAIPAKVSADYTAIIRDIAIKAGIARTEEESQMSRTIIATSGETGLARNEVANIVNALVGAGMDVAKAIEYAPVASKFVIGQGSDANDTAKMINALGQNAKITDPAQMQKALEAIAFQGQAGSFEAADMARWFPELLAGMGKLGITGNDAVAQLGSMLQVQMKTAGSSDEAANNLKNWMEKIGSEDVVKAYKDAGIDYKKSMEAGIAKGMSPLEASFGLAQKYVGATDPKRAKAMQEAFAKIDKEVDPKKAQEMMKNLEAALRTGDLFSDMQVKAALTAYSQNKALYQQLKKDSGSASGILDKNLAERRDTSSQKWAEAMQSVDDSMRSIGDALRPITDKVADTISSVAKSITAASDASPNLAAALTSVGAVVAVVMSAISTFKMGKGLVNLAKSVAGRGGARGGSNADAANDDEAGDGDDDSGGKTKGKAVAALVGAGVKALMDRGKDAANDAGEDQNGDGKPDAKEGVVNAGLSLLETLIDGKGEGNEGEGSGDDGPQKVFVVNASEIGGGAGGGGGPDTGNSRRRRGGRRSRRRSPRPTRPHPPPAPPLPPPAPPRVGLGARALGLAGKVGGVAKRIPGVSVMEAGMAAVDVYQNAKSQDEAAEGYGGAAGGLVGGMAGAAAGAAIGSVVPVIGTAIGALVGGVLGSMGGEFGGGWLGKTLFGGDEDDAQKAETSTADALRSKAPPEPISLLANQAAEKPSVPAGPVDNTVQITAPITLTVQGDVKDPKALVDQFMPEIERRMRDAALQVQRRSMVDAPMT